MIQLLRADSGTDMERAVNAQLAKGWDLYGPIITGHALVLGQWMVQSYPAHEYRLVCAQTFHELERDVLSLNADGFDFFQTTVEWASMMFQWMCRPVERDLSYHIGRNFTTYIPEQTDPVKLALVEHVQNVLMMVPYPFDSFRSHRSTDE